MIEKVNPQHPDKVADRIAGAIVDLAYRKSSNPKIAVEVLLGHGSCNIIIESSEVFSREEIRSIVRRIAGDLLLNLEVVRQDAHLARNQQEQVRCGDNGIFKGVPLTEEERTLSEIARAIYREYPHDGKYILNGNRLIVCQSNAKTAELAKRFGSDLDVLVNPLGDWTGGSDVDAGATNRKLGSDMAQSATGGGLHGKDLSKADVSVNIYAFLKAQETGKEQAFCCAIGDTEIDGRPYAEIVEIAKEYIKAQGGFERFAEWGLF